MGFPSLANSTTPENSSALTRSSSQAPSALTISASGSFPWGSAAKHAPATSEPPTKAAAIHFERLFIVSILPVIGGEIRREL